MKLLVPVRQVGRLEGELALDGSALIAESALDWQLNEWDAFSLEAALALREQAADGEVVVVSVGGEQAESALLACLAKGADRAVHVFDPDLAGADPLALAAVLERVARREEPDLILCGAQSSDAANGATGVALAGLLDVAHVAVVTAIALDAGELIVDRELDGGTIEVLRLALPALLTVQTGINRPRYATLRAIKQARSKPFETISPGELGLEGEALAAAAGCRTVRLSEPARGEGAAMIDGPPAQIAARIAELVGEALRA
jgi:electron transfer flavoprotein beta subunit